MVKSQSPIDDNLLAINKLLCLPKAELNQKLNQTAALLSFAWVFGVQLDYSCQLKSISATAEKRVISKIVLTHPQLQAQVSNPY